MNGVHHIAVTPDIPLMSNFTWWGEVDHSPMSILPLKLNTLTAVTSIYRLSGSYNNSIDYPILIVRVTYEA